MSTVEYTSNVSFYHSFAVSIYREKVGTCSSQLLAVGKDEGKDGIRQDRVSQKKTFVNTVMNIRVQKRGGDFVSE